MTLRTKKLEELTDLEKLGLITLSHSRLETVLDGGFSCKAKYFYQYILKIPTKSGPPALLGNVVHEVLENLLEADKKVSLEDEDEYMEEYKNILSTLDVDGIIGEDLINAGRVCIEEFLDRHDGESWPIFEKEMSFEIVLGNALLRGFIDRVDVYDDMVEITDYKAQPLDTPILTSTGWTKMGDINIDDFVIGSDGKPVKVTGVYPQGFVPAYRISFRDGTSTVCSDSHLWSVFNLQGKQSTKILTDLIDDLKTSRGQNRYSIPRVAPVEFKKRPLPYHPYIIGALLGDGGFTSTGVKLTNVDADVLNKFASLLPDNLELSHDWKVTYRISSFGKKNSLRNYLIDIGLWGLGSSDKFVPEDYLYSSVEDRIELLRGLMDTDGGCSTRTEFRTTSPHLRDAVLFLARSLGGTPMFSSHQPYYKNDDGIKVLGKTCYVVNLRLDINPFSMKSKAERWETVGKPKTSLRKTIESIERLPDMKMQCISVDAPNGLYVTEDFIVTHNTGKHEVPQKGIENNQQLGIYALAAQTRWPDKKINANLYYLRSGKQKGHLFTTDDLLAVEDTLLERIKYLTDMTNFPPTSNGRICNYCDYAYQEVCPMGASRVTMRSR